MAFGFGNQSSALISLLDCWQRLKPLLKLLDLHQLVLLEFILFLLSGIGLFDGGRNLALYSLVDLLNFFHQII